MSKRNKLAPLPRVTSKTITVGSLMGKIKRLILEEPKRLNMDAFVSRFRGLEIERARYLFGVRNVAQPQCGTVACIAGWGVVLLRPYGISGGSLDLHASEVMGMVLGHANDDSEVKLFCSSRVREFYERNEDAQDGENLPDAGTPEHAEIIAKRIDTYLSQHPEIVKRKIVVADIQKMLRA